MRAKESCPTTSVEMALPTQGLQFPSPVLTDQIVTEAVVGLLLDELEPGPFVEPSGVHEDVVRPEHDLLVAGASSEPQALLDQAAPDSHPPGAGLDEEDSKLGEGLFLLDAEDASDAFAVHLRDIQAASRLGSR